MLSEVARREKEAGIFPEAEVDLFMKATAMGGVQSSLQTDYALKPAPETYELFNDIILLSDGQVVYQGPREYVLEFFESCGFKCPERKGVADFLQEILFVAFVATTVFLRTRMHHRNAEDANLYLGALFFALIVNMFNGFAELHFTLARLPVFYKQRSLMLYPAWAFSLPSLILSIPISLLESAVWVIVTYYGIGFAPEAGRFFRQFLILFLIHQMASAMFRLLGGLCRTMTVANTMGTLTMLIVFMLRGFIIPKDSIPKWWVWGYWCSPLTYGQIAIVLNEMLDPRWDIHTDGSTNLAIDILERRNIIPRGYWYWIGAAALLGYAVFFNVLFTMALAYLNRKESSIVKLSYHNLLRIGCNAVEMQTNSTDLEAATGALPKRGMILPFTPLVMSFDNVNYLVDMPPGVTEDRLQLLRDVTGAFKSGILTALMGVSGAGKTTLMDVLAGRKTGGYIEGDIRVSGFPKRQETFARISGYCEQNDIHSPQVTVRESLIYSAFLRLPKEIDSNTKVAFVDEVMELVELDNLREGLVGLPGVTGLSTEQRKRLTIAVELVANPSIIFMDEPTSGLDARAAAIVMRTVRNTVDTGRTVVCTIHQPSIDIFEAFDELLLMKRGGKVIYAGPLGQNSHKVVEYFESIPGVPKIKDKHNPATWMLEVSSNVVELRLGIDFAESYKNSSLYKRNKALVKELSTPASGAEDLYFPSKYSESFFGQFKSCLWKQWWTYWRSPDYNSIRMLSTIITGGIFGSIFWNIGSKRDNNGDLFNIIGGMYTAVLFVGITNGQTVQPVVSIERTVFYRERAAGMYSGIPYALAQALAWTVYGLIISQFGDIDDLIEVDGMKPGKPLNQYVEDYFGYHNDFMGPVAAVLVGFTLLFAIMFIFCINVLNFQQRLLMVVEIGESDEFSVTGRLPLVVNGNEVLVLISVLANSLWLSMVRERSRDGNGGFGLVIVVEIRENDEFVLTGTLSFLVIRKNFFKSFTIEMKSPG
ncbi:hypothetical protein KI387_027954, partial [Taxus chinensis]